LVCWQHIHQHNYAGFKRLSAAGFRTAMHVPLITSGRVVGTLNTTRKEEEPYSLIEQTLMSTLGSYLAAIFENRKLFQANKHLIEALECSKQELEDKNHALDQSLRKVEEVNTQLVEIHSRADRIFSALMLALPGRVLDDKYRLEENIGNGGFGAVFRSLDLSSGKHVAVKVFRPKPGNDSAAAVERFRLEGLAASQLNHPNIVRVIESGITSDGIAYLAMELLSGIPLSTALLDRARWSAGYTLEVTRQIANALAQAHGMGVIHRDIKPDNVFLHRIENSAIVKVLDFGVSKLVGETPLHERNLVSVEGCGPGTPIYMAPERLTGSVYDGKSDVFSLGIMLYQMVGGKLSILRNCSSSLDPAHGVEDAATSALANLSSPVPDELKQLISHLLKPDAAQRPSAAELAVDLERLCREHNLGPNDLPEAAFAPGASYLEVDSENGGENQSTVLM
jgi:serine/threonine protein kinase